MEFAADLWRREPASRWLVKLVDERVHAGTIHACNEAGVVVHTTAGTLRFEPHQVEWIRPLIELVIDDWTMVAGFQAEDTTFDTWWMNGAVELCINYSAPSGFSDLVRPLTPNHKVDDGSRPSPAILAQARAQLWRLLRERSGQGVPPIAHLQ